MWLEHHFDLFNRYNTCQVEGNHGPLHLVQGRQCLFLVLMAGVHSVTGWWWKPIEPRMHTRKPGNGGHQWWIIASRRWPGQQHRQQRTAVFWYSCRRWQGKRLDCQRWYLVVLSCGDGWIWYTKNIRNVAAKDDDWIEVYDELMVDYYDNSDNFENNGDCLNMDKYNND